jgi:serine/threonine protein phosphatase PrpC
VLRVADSFSATDTGRQRRHNEDSLYARPPLFVVADGMGGAQAGEVASHTAVEFFEQDLTEAEPNLEERLAERVREANARIHELSQTNADQAGMGTTLTAVYVGSEEVVIAHVGDSRAYCLRTGELIRLTDDHSLVDELMRQGKLTPAEAEDHPQRSIITRALGPEPVVNVDTRTHRARPGDEYLLCSDGLTTMVPEARVAEIMGAYPRLRDAGAALLSAANEAGGRDNITVILFRLEDVAGAGQPPEGPTKSASGPTEQTGVLETVPAEDGGSAPPAPPPSGRVSARRPRPPGSARPAATAAGTRRPRRRGTRLALALLVVLAVVLAGGYVASTAVYFIGTNGRGLVTVFSGLPFALPGNVKLYSTYYVTGVPASSIAPARRQTLLDHSLRSQRDATDLVRRLELGQIAGA